MALVVFVEYFYNLELTYIRINIKNNDKQCNVMIVTFLNTNQMSIKYHKFIQNLKICIITYIIRILILISYILDTLYISIYNVVYRVKNIKYCYYVYCVYHQRNYDLLYI